MTSYCNQTVSVVKNNDCCSPTKHTEKYSVTLTVSDTWIMPEVTETTVLTIPNCNNILIGSWLWNSNVGYLEVVKYNSATGETVVRNIGFDGNARVGTVFPSCMDFAITGPIYLDSIDDNVTCLAADFVSPEVGSCALMKVKSTANLKKDYIIAIEIYQYKVDEVIDNFTVRVCNYGLGKVGTIEANCDGKCVPVRAINANSPCLQDEVHAANAIAVCVGGESKILVGTEEGQIATWSNGSGEWQLINSNIEVDCTVTTNFVNIIYGNVGPYLLNVVSTAPFKVGDRITFNNEHDAYTVSEIISDTQLRLLRNEPSTEFDYVIDAGARLCIVDCCDWLPAYVENLAARITDVENVNNIQNTQITNLADAIEDLRNTKENIFQRSDLLTEPSGILDIDRSYHVIIGEGDATITLDTDLSKYDNTQKHFVVDGANVGSGVAVYDGHADNNTTGDRTLNFRAIKSANTSKLTVTQSGGDIVIDNIYTPTIPSVNAVAINEAVTISNSDINLGANHKSQNLTGSVIIPTSHTGSVMILGTAVVTIQGIAYNDTHYAHPYSGSTKPSSDFSDYSFVANAKNCRIISTAGITIVSPIVTGVTYDEGYFHIPTPNNPISAPNPTKQSGGRITQTLTLPFAATLASLSANTTIDLPITVECPNATASSVPTVDEAIWAQIQSVTANVSAIVYKL